MKSGLKYILLYILVIFTHKAQNISYKVDTVYIPGEALRTSYPLAKHKVCHSNGTCSYEYNQYLIVKGDKLFLYNEFDLKREKKSWVEFKGYEFSDTHFVLLFDTVLGSSYISDIRYTPYFLREGVVVLVGHNLIVYDYKRGKLWDYWANYYRKHGSLRKAMFYQYYHSEYLQPVVDGDRLYLSPIPFGSYRELKKTHEWYKAKSLLEYRYEERGDSFVFEVVDSLCYFPRVCKGRGWYPTFLPMVWVDRSGGGEIYLSWFGIDKIGVYDRRGKIMRYLPRKYDEESYPSAFFMVSGRYLWLFWVKFTRSNQFARVLDKYTGAEVGNLPWDSVLREMISDYELVGYGGEGVTLFFSPANVYSLWNGCEKFPLLRVRFYVE